MSYHLSNRDLNGYIHQTLTDAQRETMDRHLVKCPQCRARIEEVERWQRRISQDLTAELRQVKPSKKMSFSALTPGLNRARQVATLRFYTWQLFTNVVALLVIIVLSNWVFRTLQSDALWPNNDDDDKTKSQLLQAAWDDRDLFSNNVIASEQDALDQMDKATIYHLDLTIGSDLQHVRGRQEVRYTNQTAESLEELYFRLLPNAVGSSLVVTNVLVNDRPVTPLHEPPMDLRLSLPEKLVPGAQAIIQMDFDLNVSRTRQGLNGTLAAIDQVLTLAHFHPAVAVHQEGTWQLDQPAHGVGGFPENSFFLVRVTAPSNLILIASGVEVSRNVTNDTSGSQQVTTFVAGPINHFYLTASERYKAVLNQTVGETRVNSYANSEYLLQDAEEALGYAVAALELFNRQFGPYPYRELDIIGMPTLSLRQDGVSYPGIALIGLDRYDFGQQVVEATTVRGIAYQWFGRLVGPNILQEPWLAESVSEYAVLDYYGHTYGEEQALSMAQKWNNRWPKAYNLSIGLPAGVYTTHEYSGIMYGRGPLFLDILANKMGRDTFTAFLRDYYQTYKWGTATSAGFKQLANHHCKCDLSPLFMEWACNQPEK
jgi:hypothetical protein